MIDPEDDPNVMRVMVTIEISDYEISPETVEALNHLPGLIDWEGV